MFKAPAFMFPTQTVLIDDDLFYAQLFADKVKYDVNIHPMESTKDVLDQKGAELLFLTPPLDSQHQLKRLLIDGIKKQCMPFDDLISSVVTDWHMAPVSGGELCNQLQSPFLRKILISNFVDIVPNSEIDHLRNQGVLQAVLDKTDQLSIKLPAVLLRCKIDFFTKLSEELFDSTSSPLSDHEFASLFTKVIYDFKPDFIWPIGKDAFTFSKTAHSESLTLYVTTKEHIDALLDSHRVENAPRSVVERLQSGDFIIAHEDPLTLDGSNWEKLLRPAKKLHGQLADYVFCSEMVAHYV